MQVTVRTGVDLMEALLPEWTHLFHESKTTNPFAHPIWMTTWARHYLRPSQIHLITVRGEDETLVGVAPFYRWHHRIGRWRIATTVHLFGAGHHVGLTEITQILILPGMEREVLRAILYHFVEHSTEWDWLELVLPPEQGWFEPQWLPNQGPAAGSFVLHKATRACVVLPLPSTWEQLRAGLKRNVKESLRRGHNSLKREKHEWRFTIPNDLDGLHGALQDLKSLHQARASVDKKIRHPDYLRDSADQMFLHDVASRMFSAGSLTPCILSIDDKPVAARLLLHANHTTFFCISGFDPEWWPYNVATTLMAECVSYAIQRKDDMANLSPGPDVAKLRWSEQLALYQEFMIVGHRYRSLLTFLLFWLTRAVDLVLRERHRHRTLSRSTPLKSLSPLERLRHPSFRR